MEPFDALNISIDWSNLGKILEEDHLKSELVMDLPPVEGNEDYWTSTSGIAFASVRERQKHSYRYGLMVGGVTSGDTFQIAQMDGRKPPSRK